MSKQDDFFMHRCLELAAKAKASGKTPVGAVLVRNDEIIAEGIEGSRELPALLSHAEIVAIINAINTVGSKDLHEHVLYTNVEPCLMCSYLIRETAISKVVYGTRAGEIGGAEGQYPILISTNIPKWNKPIIVTKGRIEDESQK